MVSGHPANYAIMEHGALFTLKRFRIIVYGSHDLLDVQENLVALILPLSG
jgi:hypothetical protein